MGDHDGRAAGPEAAAALVTLASIQEAAAGLPDRVRGSPVVGWDEHGWLKLESLQPTGSFKIRGALTMLRRLAPDRRARGVVAYSSGNHGLAVARAARMFGVRATVVAPRDAPASKVAAIVREGATLISCGPGSEERRVKAQQLAESTGQALVPPYNNRDVMAGQGTIGLELLEQLPQLSSILIPIGGGGLISGIAAAVKAVKPSVRLIGVEPELAADAQESLAAGKAVKWPAAKVGRTIADSLRTQSLGPLSFMHIAALVDEIVTVSEEEILDAAVALLSERHLVVEPAGAVSVAALRSGKFAGERTAAVVSGGNASIMTLTEILRRTERTQMSALKQGTFADQLEQETFGDPSAPQSKPAHDWRNHDRTGSREEPT